MTPQVQQIQPDENLTKIGTIIRQIRHHQQISLSQLAKSSGVSKSNLSKVENALISPTYETIGRIARGLGVPAAALLTPPTAADPIICIAKADAPSPTPKADLHHAPLFPEGTSDRLHSQILTLQSASSAPAPNASLPSAEMMCHVLEGRLTLRVENADAHVLEAGDSAFLTSLASTQLENAEGAPARILWVEAR